MTGLIKYFTTSEMLLFTNVIFSTGLRIFYEMGVAKQASLPIIGGFGDIRLSESVSERIVTRQEPCYRRENRAMPL